MVRISRFDVCLVNLDPCVGSEIKKTRPCLLISPDSMNHSRLNTVIIAPMTTVMRDHFPTRIDVEFGGKQGQVVLDQIRAVDRGRIVKVLGVLHKSAQKNVFGILKALFS